MSNNYVAGHEPVPGYRLIRFLGRGGFGEVWEVAAPGGARAALKIIRLDGRQGQKEFRAIQLVKNIHHANLVPITALWMKDDTGQIAGDLQAASNLGATAVVQLDDIKKAANFRAAELLIAMGLGDKSLYDRLRECQKANLDGIPVEELLEYLEDAAKGIDFLNSPKHDLGKGPVAIQHGDIKPQNIMLVGNSAQVCDFGLARVLSDNRVSMGGGVGLSPAYASPETLKNDRTSNKTDQYSLAISYYELRTGTLPFPEDSALMDVVNSHLNGHLDLSLLNASELAVIQRATHLEPKNRFDNCTAMVKALRRAVDGSLSEGSVMTSKPMGMTIGYNPPGNSIHANQGVGLGYTTIECAFKSGKDEVWRAIAPGSKPAALIIRELTQGRDSVDLNALSLLSELEDLERHHLSEFTAFWLIDAKGRAYDKNFEQHCRPNEGIKLIIAGKLAKKNLLQRMDECVDLQHRVPLEELLDYMQQISDGLDYLNTPQHEFRGRRVSIQHQNVRPMNILYINPNEARVRLGNFGFARLLDGDNIPIRGDCVPNHALLAPEILNGRITRWSDQYSLALTYLHLRLGIAPYDTSKSTTALISDLRDGKLSYTGLSPMEAEVVAKATFRQPEGRFPCCRLFVEALAQATGVALRPLSQGSAIHGSWDSGVMRPLQTSRGSGVTRPGESPGQPQSGQPQSGQPLSGHQLPGQQYGTPAPLAPSAGGGAGPQGYPPLHASTPQAGAGHTSPYSGTLVPGAHPGIGTGSSSSGSGVRPKPQPAVVATQTAEEDVDLAGEMSAVEGTLMPHMFPEAMGKRETRRDDKPVRDTLDEAVGKKEQIGAGGGGSSGIGVFLAGMLTVAAAVCAVAVYQPTLLGLAPDFPKTALAKLQALLSPSSPLPEPTSEPESSSEPEESTTPEPTPGEPTAPLPEPTPAPSMPLPDPTKPLPDPTKPELPLPEPMPPVMVDLWPPAKIDQMVGEVTQAAASPVARGAFEQQFLALAAVESPDKLKHFFNTLEAKASADPKVLRATLELIAPLQKLPPPREALLALTSTRLKLHQQLATTLEREIRQQQEQPNFKQWLADATLARQTGTPGAWINLVWVEASLQGGDSSSSRGTMADILIQSAAHATEPPLQDYLAYVRALFKQAEASNAATGLQAASETLLRGFLPKDTVPAVGAYVARLGPYRAARAAELLEQAALAGAPALPTNKPLELLTARFFKSSSAAESLFNGLVLARAFRSADWTTTAPRAWLAVASFEKSAPDLALFDTLATGLLVGDTNPVPREVLLRMVASANRSGNNPQSELKTLTALADLWELLEKAERQGDAWTPGQVAQVYEQVVKPAQPLLTRVTNNNKVPFAQPYAKLNAARGVLIRRSPRWPEPKPFDDGLAAFAAALKVDKDNADYLAGHSLFGSLVAKPDWTVVLADAQAALSRDPKHPLGQAALGQATLTRARTEQGATQAKSREQAKSAFDAALDLSSRTPVSKADLALLVYLNRSTLSAELAVAGDAAAKRPALQAALADATQAIKLIPSDARAWTAKGLVLETLGSLSNEPTDYALAEAAFDEALKLDGQAAGVWLARGRVRQMHAKWNPATEASRLSQAVADFKQALALDSALTEANYWMGRALFQLKDYPAAQAALAAAAKADTTSSAYLGWLAMSMVGANNNRVNSEALAVLGQSLDRMPLSEEGALSWYETWLRWSLALTAGIDRPADPTELLNQIEARIRQVQPADKKLAARYALELAKTYDARAKLLQDALVAKGLIRLRDKLAEPERKSLELSLVESKKVEPLLAPLRDQSDLTEDLQFQLRQRIAVSQVRAATGQWMKSIAARTPADRQQSEDAAEVAYQAGIELCPDEPNSWTWRKNLAELLAIKARRPELDAAARKKLYDTAIQQLDAAISGAEQNLATAADLSRLRELRAAVVKLSVPTP